MLKRCLDLKKTRLQVLQLRKPTSSFLGNTVVSDEVGRASNILNLAESIVAVLHIMVALYK